MAASLEVRVPFLDKAVIAWALRLPPEAELRRQALDLLIEERVMITSARDSGVKIDEPEVERAIQSIAAQNQITAGELISAVPQKYKQLLAFVEPEVPFEDTGTPTWDGLPLDRYLSLLDMLNPMHRLWSDGRWNKLTVAHGCYWKKCSFCDVGLDYIGRYDAASAEVLVDRIEQIVAETGQTGFHFVDEAAPPKSLKALAAELQRRGTAISWWGNVRFEKSYSRELCEQLADSGCIAISGGLEVASDRLLALMKKGVSVDQVARVTKGFADAGVLVHAYLMYGFPTQTVQDTVDALEYVRQLFEAGCIQSGFWHRFTATVHSPVGQHPADYGIQLQPLPTAPIDPEGRPLTFARNDVGFTDPTGVDHDTLGAALKKAIYNYMHGMCVEDDVRRFFNTKVPRPTVKRDFVARALGS